MKEETTEFPSYSIEYLDDVIEGDDPNLDPLISDISVQQTSDSESEPEVQKIRGNFNLKWAFEK